MRTCRCGGAVSPSRLRRKHYICSRCYNARPGQQAARARYRASAKWRASCQARNARENRRRIFIAHDYHSKADTVEHARTINAHIKERRLAFKQGQSNREEAQGPTAG